MKIFSILLLSSLLLSSCISTVHQYAARRALVADEVLVLRTPIQNIWQLEDKFYAAAIWERGAAYNVGFPSTASSISLPNRGLN